MRRPSGMLRSLAATIGLALATTLAVATPGAAAAPQQSQANPTITAQHTVTLLTGDVVQLNTLSNGDATATIKPAANGLAPSYASRKVDNDLYVIPTQAMPMLAAGKLDQELFNVTALVANGYDDSRSATLPLIVQYQPGLRAAAAPPGATPKFNLRSINATSLQENKNQAGAFWGSVTGATQSEGVGIAGVSPTVGKIWLNRRATATLSESVPQVGAPQAWAAGFDGTGVKVAVLDTGIDTTHPDLDGDKVIAAQNFSDDTDTTDHFGHGTHVASIVAGRGVGAPTVRKGVAPGASLINAKVLNSGGSGTTDQIIAGLEWAAEQGADVANMSLGIQAPHDGSPDPLIQAVDSISKSSGMLIVIAAGNLGPGDTTVSSPGWADEALTVGAVDKQDALAAFSSRGPRGGDFAIKPDITAPGVGIVAARAAGSTLGPIVDGNYMQLNGTSMATPHVAGAAAILHQRFPDYSREALKNTLISTAKTVPDQTVYQQGGGRLDVARAYSQKVYASPGTLNLGFFPFPHTGQQPVSKEVSYTNDSDTDVTFALSLRVSGKDSGPAPDGMFGVDQSSITVPAHGSASVHVSANPNAGPLDRFGGWLVATSGDTVVHTSVGAVVEPEMYNVTVNGIARDGRPAAVISWAEMWSLQSGEFTQKFFSQTSSTVTFRVRPGTYNLFGYLATADAGNTFALEAAGVAEPQLEVTGDRTITLDARTANQITFNSPKPIAPTTFTLSYHRDMGELNFHSSFTLSPPISKGFAAPTATVTKGGFEFYSKWDEVAPPLLAKVTKPTEIPLDPQPMTNAVPVDGKLTLPLVYVGLGKPEDYVGRDVRGKIALISRGELTFADKIKNATAAGAWGALIFNNRPGLLLAGAGNPGEVSIHGMTIEQAPGTILTDLLSQGPVSVQVSGTAVSPYLYDLLLPEKQRIPANLDYTVSKATTATVATRYTADVAGTLGTDVRHISRPWPTFSVGFVRDVPRPLQRTYLVSANDTRWWHIAWSHTPFDGEFDSVYTQYQPKQLLSERWFGRVSRPGGTANFDPQGVVRTEDEFSMAVFPHSDSDGHHGWGTTGDVHRTQLFVGAQLLKETDTPPFGTFPALPGRQTYRMTLDSKRANAWSSYSTESLTTWVFSSTRPAEGQDEHPALAQVDFDLPLDGMNRTEDRGDYTFGISVGHMPGSTGPDFRSAQAWVSFNDGGTWQKITLDDQGDGSFDATIHHPKIENTTGAVSLRVKATDRAGNSVDQTVFRAYGLKAAG